MGGFKGRIFSKFSEAKLAALTEVGIHNVISLFLTLAVSTGLLDIVSRNIAFQSQCQIQFYFMLEIV